MKRTFEGFNKQPRSKKGWQEWHHKYALAFFSDQLDRVVHSASERHYVTSLLKNWEKRFRAEWEIKSPELFPGFSVEGQVDFVTEYVACAILDGASKENYERIEHFLSMQSVPNTGDRVELMFMGGNLAYAYVDSLKDIDIADVFFITEFKAMDVYRPKFGSRKWTTRATKRFIDEVKEDVLSDFPEAEVIYNPFPGIEQYLEIVLVVDEAALLLKRFQCTPKKFAERFRRRPKTPSRIRTPR